MSRSISRVGRYTPFVPVTPIEALAPGKAGKTGKTQKSGKSRNAGEHSAINAVLAPQARRIPALDMARPRNENNPDIAAHAVVDTATPNLMLPHRPPTLLRVAGQSVDRFAELSRIPAQ